MRKILNRVNARLAQKAFQAAQHDVGAAQSRLRASLVIANILGLLILLSPVAVALGAGWILYVGHTAVLGWLLAALLLALAWVLLPQRRRNTEKTLTRDDVPPLFDLLDEVCAELNAPQIDGVHVLPALNAYLLQYRLPFGRKRNILGLGLPLWYTPEPQARLALIAHEVGHMVNRDPGRSLIIGYAMDTTARWAFWLQPDYNSDIESPSAVGPFMNTVLEVFGLLCETIWTFLHWSMMYHSQIAEYVADAKSVAIAGKDAAHKLLFTSILGDEAARAIRGESTRGKPQGGWIIDHIAKALRETDAERVKTYMEDAQAEKSSVDQSHPPTVYRMAFVEDLPDAPAKLVLGQAQADAIDAALKPYKDDIGAKILRDMELP